MAVMTDAPGRQVLGGLWHWWTLELKGLLPSPVAGKRRGRRKLIVLSKQGDDIVVELRRDTKRQEIARMSAAGDPRALAGELSAIDRFQRKGYALGLHLDPGDALIRTLDLPRVAEEALTQVIAHQIDHLTPLPVERIYHDHVVLGRDLRSDTIKVRIAIVPRAAVDDLVATLRSLELAPDYVDVEGPESGRRNLLASAQAPARPRRTARLNAWLLAINLALLAAAVGLPFVGWELHERRLEDQLSVARDEARVIQALRGEIELLQAERAFLETARAQVGSRLRVLDELSALLPDDTWLEDLTLRSGEAVLAGQSRAAAMLIGVLQDSPLFEDVRFDAPIVKDDETERERFRVRLSVRRDGQG